MHAVYVGRENHNAVCIVADDKDNYLSLTNISCHIHSHLYFRPGKTKDKYGVNYYDIHVIGVHLGEQNCQILPCFHTLTGPDFTNVQLLKMLEAPKSHKLLLSSLSDQPNIDEGTHFVLHIVYNRSSQPAFTCSKLTIETLEQGVKYVQS